MYSTVRMQHVRTCHVVRVNGRSFDKFDDSLRQVFTFQIFNNITKAQTNNDFCDLNTL